MAVAPSTARAFIGESTVLNAGKTDLTAPAKSILTNPTFLTETAEEAAVLGGTEEATGAAAVFEGAGILPALGAVVSFGVGTVIGSEICGVLGIEGCWYHGSEGADPSVSGGSWQWLAAPPHTDDPLTTPNPAFSWWWRKDGGWSLNESTSVIWAGAPYADNPAGCGISGKPGSASGYHVTEYNANACGAGISAAWGGWFRLGMENRVLEYHATDDPEIENYSHSAPSDWSEKLATQLKNHEGDASGRVGQKIASKIEGSEVKNPYQAYVSIPDCDGLVYATCAKELEEAGLEPQREEIDWSEVTTTTPAEVLELEPAPETEVEVPSKVTVITNPDEEGMPLVIPAPEAGETYDDYAARLNPALEPTQKVVSDANADAELGADAVLATDPSGGSKLPPTGGQVDVYTNPPYMAPGGAAWEPPEVPGIDLSPFEMVTPCEVFPFGAACWFVEAIEDFALVSGKCPTWDMEFLGVLSSEHDEQELGLCAIAPVVEGVRPWVFFVGSIFMVLTFAAIARSGGTPSDQAANSAADRAD